MRTLILAVAMFLIVPTLRAQQADAKENPPQTGSQQAPENGGVQATALPENLKPGHPLDPADVDILTGKRDREIEASRTPAVSVVLGGYAGFGQGYAINGNHGGAFDSMLLPLTRINNGYVGYLFFAAPPRGFAGGGFRGRH